jgi:hypothetical protein
LERRAGNSVNIQRDKKTKEESEEEENQKQYNKQPYPKHLN